VRRFLLAAAAFNYSFLSLTVLVPLAAERQGYSLAAIGALTALPGVMQLGLRLTGGVLADVWGSVQVMRACFAATTVAALPLLGPRPGVAAFVLAMLLNGVARGAFWPAAQTYASQAGHDAARDLSRLFSVTSVGSIAALVASGALAARCGYPVAFGAAGAAGACCLLLSLRLTAAGGNGARRGLRAVLAPLPRLAARPAMVMAGVVAFAASTPNVLGSTFYPVVAVHLGFGTALATALTAVRNGGNIAGASVFPALLRRLGHRRTVAVSLFGIAAALAATPLLRHPLPFTAGLALAGVCGQLANLGYLWLATQESSPGERGSAIAVTGFWWAVAVLAVPALFGPLAQAAGLAAAFVAAGLLTAGLGAAFVLRPLPAAAAAEAGGD
jgi:MFS family permease